MAVGANAQFTKYLTFPNDVDAEAERFKLEFWLYLLMEGIDPMEYMRGIGITPGIAR